MHIDSAVNLIVHVERTSDGIRRVQSVAEIAGMEGDIITSRELFSVRHRCEREEGANDGVFASSRIRPHFVTRAKRFGFRKALLDALDFGGP